MHQRHRFIGSSLGINEAIKHGQLESPSAASATGVHVISESENHLRADRDTKVRLIQTRRTACRNHLKKLLELLRGCQGCRSNNNCIALRRNSADSFCRGLDTHHECQLVLDTWDLLCTLSASRTYNHLDTATLALAPGTTCTRTCPAERPSPQSRHALESPRVLQWLA